MSKGEGLAFVLVIGFALAGCGETSEQSVPPPQGGAVDEVLGKALDLYCKALFECPIPSDDTLSEAVAFGNQARCRDVLSRAGQSTLIRGWDDLRRRERDGSIRVNGEAVERCFEAQSCQVSFDFQQGACRAIFAGTVIEGQPCLRTEQCAGNAYCDHSEQACPGVCVARKAPGSPCSSADECSAQGSGRTECDYANSSGTGTCTERVESIATEGQACSLVPSPGAEIVLCTPGLWCDEAASGTGVCRKPLPPGESCDTTDDVCVTGAFCHGPPGLQTCQTVELLGVGQSCARLDSEPPRMCDVFAGSTCDTTSQVCVVKGRSRGSRCDISDLGDLIPCDTGLYCRSSTRTCEPQVAEGQPCDSDQHCNAGQCSSTTRVCVSTYCDG
jgi:hypothetical protein